MLNLDLLLKRNEVCLVGRAPHRGGLHETGLYVRDTRFLSSWSVTFKNEPLMGLDLQVPNAHSAVITSTNPPLRHLDLGVEPQTILVRQAVRVDTEVVVTFTVQNFGSFDLDGELLIDLAADFRDMFDIRGMPPRERPRPVPAILSDTGVTLAARSTDRVSIETELTVSTDWVRITPHPPSPESSGATLVVDLDLPRQGTTSFELRISPKPFGDPLEAPSIESRSSDFTPRVGVQSPSEQFDTFIAQCDADLAMLQTTFPDGNIPAAGIPWYIAPFGRDSLIVGLQTMHAYPDRVAATLRTLAALQATEEDPWREAQPGKILHEMRYGDMARTGQIPHTPYYGSIDSTPLFVMTFAQHYLWHRDDRLFDELIDNVRRALDWIETYGDLDGDGLIEFTGVQKDRAHIAQQGWKDSGDSLHFADGREVDGPIALVEVQGYVYAAYRWLSEALRLRGDAAWADELVGKAEAVRELVEQQFWMEDAGFYAQGLDGSKRQIDAISSNPGHLLFCGLPRDERAARLAARLAEPDLNTGWGIRTLSSDMATYNPMSYHNGSIWPHDFSLTMAGLRDYGHNDLARELAMALLTLASTSPNLRIAELYCGFSPMSDVPTPVAYPVSCIPQAWAAGAGLLATRTLLGLKPLPAERQLAADPDLPAQWSSLSMTGLNVFGEFVDVSVERCGDGYDVRITPGHD